MIYNKDTLAPYLLYSLPIKYNEFITLYPILMKQVLEFQLYSKSITLRKDSRFSEKAIIKMNYFEFLVYAANNKELGFEYGIPDLSLYYQYAFMLLNMVCQEHKITFSQATGEFIINDFVVTAEIFDDLRRIIILQNDIDFDIDEFMNYDTEKRLLKAQKDSNKNQENIGIEDYIDSLSIAINLSEQQIMNMTIRKFWRYIKRYQLKENYTLCKTGECSGMVKYKEPIKHWISSLDVEDKYSSLKANEDELKAKING